MKLSPLDPSDPHSAVMLRELWNAAMGPKMEIPGRLARFNLEPAGGAAITVCLAEEGDPPSGGPAGLVLACAAERPMAGEEYPGGWIEALTVSPGAQGKGAGSLLLARAEDWLRGQGCRAARLGGGLRPFFPGVPTWAGAPGFFIHHGYGLRAEEGTVWDMARRLEGYTTPDFVLRRPPEVSPVGTGETAQLEAFLGREFPGRWQYEFREHLRLGGAASDFLALRLDGEIQGFCELTFENSLRPVERFHPHGLPRPWGQLGPIGIAAAQRGRGLGEALLDAGLRRLQARGVDGCVIDWVSRPAFYQKFGFSRHHEFQILTKKLV